MASLANHYNSFCRVKEARTKDLRYSIEDAMKIVISGGMLGPTMINCKIEARVRGLAFKDQISGQQVSMRQN